jgi:hypothetical protein
MPFALIPKALGIGVGLLSGANALKDLTGNKSEKTEKTPPDDDAGGDHIGKAPENEENGEKGKHSLIPKFLSNI